jgi:flagellar biosynthesis protein FlhF
MRVLKIKSSSMRDALAEVKRQLGDDAAVLHAKQFEEPSWFGLAKKRGVEVLAAVEDDAVPAESAPASDGIQRIEGQVSEIRKTLGDLMSGLAVVRERELSPAVERLVKHGVSDSIAESLLSGCADDDAQALREIARRIRCVGPINCDRRQARVALVGPTGVGKTTTAAKLAAQYALVHKKKVALLTVDTYRVGAVEQLATYARILNIPLDIAMSLDDVATLVAKHEDKDLIVIDTVGRSQRNGAHVSELSELVNAAGPTETHLVVSASADAVARREAVDAFGRIGIDRVVMTKLDECARPGCVLDLAVTSLLPYSYVTFGQDVPDDIAVAESDRLAKLVWEGAL